MASVGFNLDQNSIISSFLAPYQANTKKYSRYEKLANQALSKITSASHEFVSECCLIKKSGLFEKYAFYARMVEKENEPVQLQIFQISKQSKNSTLGSYSTCVELHNCRESVAYFYKSDFKKNVMLGTNVSAGNRFNALITEPMKKTLSLICGDHIPLQLGRDVFITEKNPNEKFVCIYSCPGKPLSEIYERNVGVVDNNTTYSIVKDVLGVLVLLEMLDLGSVTINPSSFTVQDGRAMLYGFTGLFKLPPNDGQPFAGVLNYDGDYLSPQLAKEFSEVQTNAGFRKCIQKLTRYSFACILVEIIQRIAGNTTYTTTKNEEETLTIASVHLTQRKEYLELLPKAKNLIDMIISEDLPPIKKIMNDVIHQDFAEEIKRMRLTTDQLLDIHGF